MTTKLGDETYLGGGLYVSFDGWYVILRAPRDDGKETWVAREPPVVSAFLDYVEEIKAL
jgi:hypothetical protein